MSNVFQPSIGSSPKPPVPLPTKPGGGMPEDFTGWMIQLWEHVRSLAPQGDNQYIAVDWRYDGIVVKLNPNTIPVPPPVSAVATGTIDTGYTGPFKVSDYSDETNLLIYVEDGSNSENSICGYYLHGTERAAVPASEPLIIGSSCSVYLKITHNGINYVFEFDTGSAVPTSSNGTLYREIARITVTDGAISAITQVQQGDLITPGVL